MNIAINKGQALPFYTSIQERCSCADGILVATDSLPPFQILGESVGGIQLVDCNGNQTSLSSNIISGYIDENGVNFVEYNGSAVSLPAGLYHIFITIDGNRYWSDWIRICGPTGGCIEDKAIELEWWNDCQIKDVAYYQTGFKQRLKLDAIFDTPISLETETLKENGFGKQTIKYRRVQERHVFEFCNVTDGQLLSFNLIRSHSNVIIRFDGIDYEVENVSFESRSDGHCSNIGRLSFEICCIQVTGCCDDVDVDDIDDPCGAIASTISALGDTAICKDDTPPQILVNGGTGTNSTFIVVDSNDVIVLITSSNPVDYSDLPSGNYTIYHVNYDGTTTGLQENNPIDSLGGCFALSNEIDVSVAEECCEITINNPDPVACTLVNVTSSGVVMTSPSGGTLSYHASQSDADNNVNPLTGTAITAVGVTSTIYVRYESFNCVVFGEIQVTIENPQAGDIFTDSDVLFCNDIGDIVIEENIPCNGTNTIYVVTDLNDTLLHNQTSPNIPSSVFVGFGVGEYLIYQICYGSDPIVIGQDINNTTGCHDISNSIGIEVEACLSCNASTGTLNVDDVCEGESIPASVTGNNTSPLYSQVILLADSAGTIIQSIIGNSGSFTPVPIGTYEVAGYNYETNNGCGLPIIGIPLQFIDCAFGGCGDLMSTTIEVTNCSQCSKFFFCEANEFCIPNNFFSGTFQSITTTNGVFNFNVQIGSPTSGGTWQDIITAINANTSFNAYCDANGDFIVDSSVGSVTSIQIQAGFINPNNVELLFYPCNFGLSCREVCEGVSTSSNPTMFFDTSVFCDDSWNTGLPVPNGTIDEINVFESATGSTFNVLQNPLVLFNGGSVISAITFNTTSCFLGCNSNNFLSFSQYPLGFALLNIVYTIDGVQYKSDFCVC